MTIINTSNYKIEDVNRGNSNVDKEGWYHFEVAKVILKMDTHQDMNDPGSKQLSPHVVLLMEVLESVNGQSPTGSRLWHQIYVGGKGGKAISEGARKMIVKAALRTGLMKDVEGKPVKADGTGTDFDTDDFLQLESLQFIAQVKCQEGTEYIDANGEKQTYEDRYAIPFQMFYHLDDPDVAKVPKNAEMCAHAGVAAPAEAAGGDALDEILGDDF